MINKCCNCKKIILEKDKVDEENINLKKQISNFNKILNSIRNKDEDKDCPIYLYKNKLFKERDYSIKYIYELYEYHNSISETKFYGKTLEHASIDILNKKKIAPNNSNKEKWRNKIKKCHELYIIHKDDIDLVFFNIDKMINIRNKEKWDKWKKYLESKIKIKKLIEEIEIQILLLINNLYKTDKKINIDYKINNNIIKWFRNFIFTFAYLFIKN